MSSMTDSLITQDNEYILQDNGNILLGNIISDERSTEVNYFYEVDQMV